jgi:putative ABC transport system ATP-binding protein
MDSVKRDGSAKNEKSPSLVTISKNIDSKSKVLKIKNLSKIFDSPAGKVVALRKNNFSINKGEFVSIVGPSGSGKSTLLNMIGALDRPTIGQVLIDGVDIDTLNDSEVAYLRNSRIGFIFQSFNLINRSSVQKNVELPAIILGIKKQDRNRRSLKILKALGILSKKKQKPVNLSGGEQQRVAIARALMNNPTIILADEPTGNLDTKNGEEIFNMLKLLSSKLQRTIIMVTHNTELAKRTDRSIYLRDGMIEKDVTH